jgi:methylmalonyl-CoA mutase N-terminal domain/subunit
LRRERSDRAVENALSKLRRAAEEEVNLVPILLETVQSYATIGEIYSVLRDCWGEWRSL